jgi:hypothetical protein
MLDAVNWIASGDLQLYWNFAADFLPVLTVSWSRKGWSSLLEVKLETFSPAAIAIRMSA